MAGKTAKTYVWKSPVPSAIAVGFALALNAVLHLGSMAVWLIFGSASAYGDGPAVTGPESLRALLDLAILASYFLCGVTLFWIVRVSKNAHAFRPSLKVSPMGAIGWYLVPFASLYKPYEAMSEIWSASVPATTRGKDRLLNWWWGAFLLSNIVGAIAVRIVRGLPGAAPTAGILRDVLVLGSAGIFAVLVYRLTQMQMSKRRAWHDADVFGPPVEAAPNVLERLNI